MVISMLAPEPGFTVLDVATGAGHTAVAAAPLVRLVVAGDLAVEMLAETRILSQKSDRRNVVTLLMDAHRLPFADHTFDAVTCRIAAHHFRHFEYALAETARVLKQGGRYVVEDSTVPDDHALAAFINRVEALRDRTHVRSRTPSQWEAALLVVGLNVVSTEIHRKAHDIEEWMTRAGLDWSEKERVREAFTQAPKGAQSFFEIIFDQDGRACSYTDDKLILRADKHA